VAAESNGTQMINAKRQHNNWPPVALQSTALHLRYQHIALKRCYFRKFGGDDIRNLLLAFSFCSS